MGRREPLVRCTRCGILRKADKQTRTLCLVCAAASVSKNLFFAYERGWADGAAIHAMDPVFAQCDSVPVKDAYTSAYVDGRAARNAAMELASTKYGHPIRIVTLADTTDA